MAGDAETHNLILNSEGDDFGFDTGSDEAFSRSSEAFRESFGRSNTAEEEDIIDAEFVEVGQGGGQAPDAVDSYLDALNRWEGGPDFVNDARKVEAARALRLDLAQQIADNPTLISSPKLAKARKANGENFKGDPREYLRADIAYNDRPDPASTRYADFARERAKLRDALFGDSVVVGAEDYRKLTQRTQGVMMRADKVAEQYDLIDLRKEAALEHYDNPRFIAEVALAAPHGSEGTSGILDELLLDLDRKDLLAEHLGTTSAARTDAMAKIFSESVHAVADRNGDDKITASEKISKFQNMRETGRSIRHNHLAIAKFARAHSGEREQGALDLGLAALDNTSFSRGLYDRWISGLSNSEASELRKKRSVVATFGVARKQFENDFDAASPRAAETFAILEQAATQILDNPEAERRLINQGDIDDVAALQLFSQRYKERALGEAAAARVEEDVISRMGENISTVGKREGSADLKTEDGNAYHLDLEKAGAKAQVRVVDGAHIMVSNSAEDAKEGKGAILRLEGIMAPPEGSETRSGGMDAGIESKSHLEEVVNRHGVASLGLKIKTLKSGETVVKARLSTGENLSQRMLRDGYVLPVKDGDKGDRREHMAKQAEANRRGLWEAGFPEMDESWRRENQGPNMTWHDKKLHVVNTVAQAMATSRQDVFRRLSHPETKLFGLPLKQWSANSRIDDEIDKIIRKNPARVMSIYENNLEVLKDLRKRKDKLSYSEKVAHDRLTMGNRALGSSLVSKNLLDAKQAEKNDHQFMSGSGLQLSMKGVRPMAEATAETVQQGAKVAGYGYRKAKGLAGSLVDIAMME